MCLTKNHLEDICANCGGRRGLHNNINQACPQDPNAPNDHTSYRTTVFAIAHPQEEDAFVEKHITIIKQKLKTNNMLVNIDWVRVEDRSISQDDGEVIAFCKEWIDEDLNPTGVRIGFLNGDGIFYSAKYNNTHDCYQDDETGPPTHYQLRPSKPLLNELKESFSHKPASDSDMEDRATPSEPGINPTREEAGEGSEQDAWEWVAIFYGALKELVELKDIKETAGKTDDYLERQPKAWYLAQEAIKLWAKSNYGAFPLAGAAASQQGEVERLKGLIKELVEQKYYNHLVSTNQYQNADVINEALADAWQQFKTENNL